MGKHPDDCKCDLCVKKRMTRDFYNTTGETNPELAKYRENARSQQEIILKFLQDHPGQYYTVDEIHDLLFKGKVPRRSMSRAITNLCEDGFIEKSEDADWQSIWDRRVHAWRIPPLKPGGEQRPLF